MVPGVVVGLVECPWPYYQASVFQLRHRLQVPPAASHIACGAAVVCGDGLNRPVAMDIILDSFLCESPSLGVGRLVASVASVTSFVHIHDLAMSRTPPPCG